MIQITPQMRIFVAIEPADLPGGDHVAARRYRAEKFDEAVENSYPQNKIPILKTKFLSFNLFRAYILITGMTRELPGSHVETWNIIGINGINGSDYYIICGRCWVVVTLTSVLPASFLFSGNTDKSGRRVQVNDKQAPVLT